MFAVQVMCSECHYTTHPEGPYVHEICYARHWPNNYTYLYFNCLVDVKFDVF